MSKTKAKAKVTLTQNPVPDAFASTIKVSEDTKTCFLTFSVPRYFDCVVREKIQNKPALVSVPIDAARIFGSTRLRAIFERGLKKQLIDGAKGQYQRKNEDTGEAETVKLSFEEAHADAISTAERNVEWLYGIRDKQDYVSGGDPVTDSCVDQISTWIVKNCQTDTGGRYTKSKMPKVLKGTKTLEDFRVVAAQFGATEKRIERIIANAQNMHGDLDDDELDVDTL